MGVSGRLCALATLAHRQRLCYPLKRVPDKPQRRFALSGEEISRPSWESSTNPWTSHTPTSHCIDYALMWYKMIWPSTSGNGFLVRPKLTFHLLKKECHHIQWRLTGLMPGLYQSSYSTSNHIMVEVSEDKQHVVCGKKKVELGWGSRIVLSFSLANHHSINVPNSYSSIYYQYYIFQI